MKRIHETAAAANEAVEAFCQKVDAIAELHGIASLYVVIGITHRDDDGNPIDGMTAGGSGDVLRHETLLGYGLGQARTESRRRVNRLITGRRDDHEQA